MFAIPQDAELNQQCLGYLERKLEQIKKECIRGQGSGIYENDKFWDLVANQVQIAYDYLVAEANRGGPGPEGRVRQGGTWLARRIYDVLHDKLLPADEMLAVRDLYPWDCENLTGTMQYRCIFGIPQDAPIRRNDIPWLEEKFDKLLLQVDKVQDRGLAIELRQLLMRAREMLLFEANRSLDALRFSSSSSFSPPPRRLSPSQSSPQPRSLAPLAPLSFSNPPVIDGTPLWTPRPAPGGRSYSSPPPLPSTPGFGAPLTEAQRSSAENGPGFGARLR